MLLSYAAGKWYYYMESNTEQNENSPSRQKRIRFLRRLILISIAAAVLIPTCICVVLAVKYDRVLGTLDMAKEELAWYEEHFGESALAEDMDEEVSVSEGAMAAIDAESEGATGTLDAESDDAGDMSSNPDEDTVSLKDGETDTSQGSAGASEEDVVAGNPDEKSDIILENSEGISEEWDGIRRVYLTFDDGPSSSTGEILDILSEYQVKGTFFVTGKEGEKYAEVYKRIVDEGHTIGMHSYSHKYGEIYSSLESFATDLHQLQTFLYETTGSWCRLYRFPGGSSNTVSKVSMRDLIDYLGLENITYFDWNVASSDDRDGVTKDIIVSNVMTGIPKFHNSVVLLHDASDKRTTIEALPEIIEQVQSMENTVIVPITEDTLPVQHISNSQ